MNPLQQFDHEFWRSKINERIRFAGKSNFPEGEGHITAVSDESEEMSFVVIKIGEMTIALFPHDLENLCLLDDTLPIDKE